MEKRIAMTAFKNLLSRHLRLPRFLRKLAMTSECDFRGVPILIGILLCLCACQKFGTQVEDVEDDKNQLSLSASSVKLQKFTTFEEMDKKLKSAMIKEMESEIEGFCDRKFEITLGEPKADAMNAFAASPTNVQEANVDEADIIKSDDKYLYFVSQNKFTIFTPKLNFVGPSIEIEGSRLELYVKNNIAAVISDVYLSTGMMYQETKTKVTLIDLSNISKPYIMKESYYDGYRVSSRRIGSRLFLATNMQMARPKYEYPDCKGSDLAGVKKKNRNAIEKLNIQTLLPAVSYKNKSGERKVSINPSDLYFTDLSLGSRLTTVFEIDMENKVDEDRIDGVFGARLWSHLYASVDSIYIMSPSNPWAADMNSSTLIHKFKITEGLEYFGSGFVEGYVINQFSAGEFDGYFRIATTTPRDQKTEKPSSNNLFVLDANNNGLKEVSSVKGLAQGERIYAVRFIGRMGYVVTFKQVDPLFVIDISDPLKPFVAGELKVPGYSTYLHPIDDSHLLGIGMDVAVSKTGALIPKGMKLSLFDVGDSSQPKELFSSPVGTVESWSPAVHDHHAFIYDAKRSLLLLPVVNSFSSAEAVLFSISKSAGIKVSQTIKTKPDLIRAIFISEGGKEYVLAIGLNSLALYSMGEGGGFETGVEWNIKQNM